MTAAELRAKCKHLTLSGVDEDGELEWIGTFAQWCMADIEEEALLELHVGH